MSTDLHVAFISDSSKNSVLVCSSADGTHWSGNTNINQAGKAAPSLAMFKGAYRVAFITNNDTNNILVCSSEDGASWSDNTRIGQTSPMAPSLCVFGGKLWLAFIANDSTNRVLICSSSDGVNWSANVPVGQSSKAAPNLCVFDGKLWLAFLANDSTNRVLICSSSDGTHWSENVQVGQSSKFAPNLCALNGKLWLAFVANDSTDRLLICSSSDGTHWSGNTKIGQSTKMSPSLAAVGSTLWLAFISDNDKEEILICSSGDGTSWSANTKIGQSSKFAPSLFPVVLTSGAARPRYQVLTVVYAPPGTNGGKSTSQVSYANGSSTGTTTSISKSFKGGVDVTARVGNEKTYSASATFSYSRTTTDTSTIDVKKSDTYTVTVNGPASDGIDHDHDIFYLCLNPLLTITTDNWNNVTWDVGVDGSTMITQYVYAGWLKDPSKMPPGVKATLDKYGLTTDDYAQILSTNPFASEGTAIDTSRYMSTSQSFPYIPPYSVNDPVPVQSYNHQNTINTSESRSVQSQYTVSATVTGGVPDTWSVKVTGTLQWTNTNTSGTSSSSTQSATVAVGGPGYGYTGPTDVLVYWDSVYNSFMFAFPTEPPAAIGAVTDANGKAVANAPVTLTVNGREFTTYTDAHGNYRVYGAPSGQGTVTVKNTSHAVTVGPSAAKASVKLST